MEQRTMGIDLGIQSPNVAVVLDERGEELVSKLSFELSEEGQSDVLAFLLSLRTFSPSG